MVPVLGPLLNFAFPVSINMGKQRRNSFIALIVAALIFIPEVRTFISWIK